MKKSFAKLSSLLLCIFIILSSASMLSCGDTNQYESTAETTKGEESTAVTTADESTAPSTTEIITSTTEPVTVPEPEVTDADIESDQHPDSTEPEESTADDSSTSSIPLSVPVDPVSTEVEETPALPAQTSEIPSVETAEDATPSYSLAPTPTTESAPTETTTPSITVTDVSAAAAQGLRSAVTVVCMFNGGTSASAGSGVIYELDAESGSAFIITNYHVVYSSSSKTANRISDDISVLLYGLEYADYTISATFVGGSPNYDLAVLRVDNSDILRDCAASGSARAVSITDSDSARPGQTAIAIGNAEADGISVTTGIVSVESEQISLSSINGLSIVNIRVMRIDTAVNSGNSGGGLFNARGELIGIVNAKIKRDGVENIGYAIPANVARAIADNIIDYCYEKDCETAMRGMMGVTVTIDSITTAFDEGNATVVIIERVKIVSVTAGGLAENILEADDIVLSLSINGARTTVTRQHHLIDAMLDVRVGDTVEITILRNGAEMTVSAVITNDCLIAY